MSISHNKRLWIFILSFKIILISSLTWLVYDKIWIVNQELNFFFNFYEKIKEGKHLIFFLLCILLVPFNWIIETIKWKKLINNFQNIEWTQAYRAVMTGISLGIITPARIGEYGGRLLYITTANRNKALFAHFIGSMSQNLPILFFGALGSFFFFREYYLHSWILATGFSIFILILSLLVYFLFSQNEMAYFFLSNVPLLNKIFKQKNYLLFKPKTLQEVITLSTIRYFIYAAQYISLLYMFDIKMNLFEAIIGVSVIYLFQTGIPMPPALSILLRTELALVIWSRFSTDQVSILTVPILLWVINLLLPGIYGAYVLLTSNLNKYFNEN
jgi:uncharacterized membrane protein YbhN (UPF0104 family)